VGRDFFNTSKYTYQTDFIYQDYAGVGVNLYGYTQQFGNGIAATVSVQDPTPFEHPIVDLTAGGVAGSFGGFVGAAGSPFVLGGAPTNDAWQNGGFIVPDIVFNVRLDQAWGGAQAAAILHDNRARYYNNTLAATGTAAGASHPSDKWGWAVSGGLELNLPWAKGDSFAVQSQYCVGDSESCDNFGTRLQDLAWSLVNNNKIGLGWQNDAFFANTAATGATGLQLTTMWNIFAAIQHYWVPDVRTSRCTAALCAVQGQQHRRGYADLRPAISASGCADWAAWQIGSRTIWNPVRNLDVGVEALYTDLSKSAFGGANVAFIPSNSGQAAPGSTFTASSTHVLSGMLRVQ